MMPINGGDSLIYHYKIEIGIIPINDRMFATAIYMIRNGGFGNNFETKLYMTLIAVLVCITDMVRNKRKDYFAVFITGTLIWGDRNSVV